MATTTRPATERRPGLFSFPNPVDDRAARAVATGVVAMALAGLETLRAPASA